MTELDNQRSDEENNSRNEKWKAGFWILAFFTIAGLFIHNVVSDITVDFRLMNNGVVTNGYIIDAWEEVDEADSGEDIWYHFVEYTFKASDGKEYVDIADGNGRLPEDVRYLQPIEVTYLPHNPHISEITGAVPDSTFEVFRGQIFEIIGSALFLFLGFYNLRKLIMRFAVARKSDGI